MSLPHHCLLSWWHLSKHLVLVRLLKHWVGLSWSKMCHCVRILHRSSRSRSDWTLGHSCNHWTLCYLGPRYTWMHALHHCWVGTSHMPSSWMHDCHRVPMWQAWVSAAGSHPGVSCERLSHHLVGVVYFDRFPVNRVSASRLQKKSTTNAVSGNLHGLELLG